MHNGRMNDAAATAPSAHAPLTPRQAAWVVFALSMGGFAIGTSEFVVMGLISEIARGFGVTEPQVGHVVSAYALGVVVGAPLLAILGANMRRRTLLLCLMGFYAVGNLASALSPSYHWMMAFRFVAGLPHGAYFGVAALVAAHVSPPEQRGLAVGKVMLGLSVALLIGNPLATWMGQQWSWRVAFVLVAVIALATVAMTAWRLPSGMGAPRTDARRELRAFNRAPVWLALLGTRLSGRERLLLGLLGPRGTTTIVFGLLAFNALPDGLPADTILITTVLCIVGSVVLHGMGSAPAIERLTPSRSTPSPMTRVV